MDSGGRREAPLSYRSSCLPPGSSLSSQRLRLGSQSALPAGPPLVPRSPGLAPTHPAQNHAACPGHSQRRDSCLLRGPAVCLGKADGRGRPLLAASISGVGTGSSPTSAFAQEGETHHVTRANERQHERPAQLHGPAGRRGGSLGASLLHGLSWSPARRREHAGSYLLVRNSLSWGLEEMSPGHLGFPQNSGFQNTDANVKQDADGPAGLPRGPGPGKDTSPRPTGWWTR